MLASINDHTRKIITLENPIEYQVPGIQQSQIDEDNGYTYEE
jgi:general secretion pathway protein E